MMAAIAPLLDTSTPMAGVDADGRQRGADPGVTPAESSPAAALSGDAASGRRQ